MDWKEVYQLPLRSDSGSYVWSNNGTMTFTFDFDYDYGEKRKMIEKIVEKLNGNSIDDYTLTQYDALCCAVEVNDGNITREFRYGNLIDESEWYFINSSTNEYIPHSNSSRQPFIAKSNNTSLEQGYYDIIFNYCLTDGNVQTCKLSSAFRIKYI